VAQLQGITGLSDTFKAFVQMVRLFLRDFPELNRLIAGEETTDRMLAWCVLDALSNFNGQTPITYYTLEQLIDKQQQHLLLRMTVECVIESVALLQTRNHINYSDGGLNVGVNDKTPMLQNWLQYFRGFTEQRLQKVKVALNIESILGPSNAGAHSELWAINGSWFPYN
jgi:hypothetical protein